jgi:hypothetical protein
MQICSQGTKVDGLKPAGFLSAVNVTFVGRERTTLSEMHAHAFCVRASGRLGIDVWRQRYFVMPG